jgi:tRNA(Ile)-lysidine synthase
MLRQLRDARSTHARMRHDSRWLLRYRDRIDAAAELPLPLVPVWFRWSGQPHIDIAGQRFLFLPGAGEGIDAAWLAGTDLLMDQARGRDRLQLTPQGHLRTWKNLTQEHGIPPWIRAALPVLRHAGGIVHAAPFGFNRRAPYGESPVDSPLVRIEWVVPACVARWL